MCSAPYVIRDTSGNFHPYDLETVGAGPYGVQLIVWLQPGEALSSSALHIALKAAIVTSGQWYTLKGDKHIRDVPNTSGAIMITLHAGAQVEIVEFRKDPGTLPGQWAKILLAIVDGANTDRFRGRWFYYG